MEACGATIGIRGFICTRSKPNKISRATRRSHHAGRKTLVAQCSLGLVRKIGEQIRRGETTAEEVTRSYLDTIFESNDSIGSFISITDDVALKRARSVDDAIASGIDPGVLAGIPIAVKDNICSADGVTTAGSRLLQTHRSPYDAQVIRSLLASGAVLIGKTNLDEFGMGSTTESSAFGPTRNREI